MGEVKFSLQAGVRARWQTPISVALDGEGVSELRRGEAVVPCQSRALGDGRCELSFILDRLPAGGKAEFVATLGEPAGGGAMTVEEEGPAVAVLQNGAELSRYYITEPSAARPFWYPLPDPYGTSITRGYPLVLIDGEKQDHPHHRSLWVAYGEVNGTDNWSEQEGHATQPTRAGTRCAADRSTRCSTTRSAGARAPGCRCSMNGGSGRSTTSAPRAGSGKSRSTSRRRPGPGT